MEVIKYQRLSAVTLFPHWLKGMGHAATRALLRRAPRLRTRVAEEYDEGAWKRVRSQRRWEQAPSLTAFLVGNDQSLRVARVDGRCVRIRTEDYYRHRIEALAGVMRPHVNANEELVEIGCGYGTNLFSLSLAGTWPRLIGLDISENGIATAREIAAHFRLDGRMTFDRLDLTRGDDPGFRHIGGKTAFSHFCIEQVPYSVEAVVRNILNAKPRRVIHIEAAPELLRLWSPRDLLNYLYLRSMDYQTQLLSMLEKLEREGLIRIVERKRTAFAPTIHNDGFLIVWEPKT
jgi:SAM-dependent methyltransferase